MDERLFVGVVQFIVLLLSLSIHESAHAWTANRFGDPTAKKLGRVSLNPIVHADLLGTVILPLAGALGYLPVMFGWAKPVPVNVSRLRNPRRDHMLVAAAGPVSNLSMAAILFILLMIIKAVSPGGSTIVQYAALNYFPQESSILSPLAMAAVQGIVLNIILAVFNLIPIAPLDGASVLAGLLPNSLAAAFEQLQRYGMLFLVLLIYVGAPFLLYGPIISYVLSCLRAA